MIDWDRVAQLRDEVGQNEFAEVVDLFLEEVEEATERLAALTDARALAENLHFLKGCALNLGFVRFGAMCQEAERAAVHGANETVEVGAILACYRSSRKAFLDGLAQRRVA